MRIRTIKPEFWNHRMHEVVSETAALVAIGLLNIADDEGRFLANPRAIESVIFPIRGPKKSVSKCLDELETAGFIVRYKALMDGRETALAMIPNFRKHQVISKPYASRLAPPPFQYHSGNDTGTFQDPNHDRSTTIPDMEGKGKERKGREEEGAAATPRNPLWPTIESWIERVANLCGDDEWSRQWWERKWFSAEKTGWTAGPREISNWQAHQDSLMTYFRSDHAERKESAPAVLTDEQLTKQLAEQRRIEQTQAEELRAAILEGDRE